MAARTRSSLVFPWPDMGTAASIEVTICRMVGNSCRISRKLDIFGTPWLVLRDNQSRDLLVLPLGLAAPGCRNLPALVRDCRRNRYGLRARSHSLGRREL